MLEIKVCEDKIFWNDQIQQHNSATYAHLYQWKNIIEKSYRLHCYYLIVYENHMPISFLPFTLFRTLKGQKKGVSLAFNSYGGIIGKDNNEVKEILRTFIKQNYHIQSLELRNKKTVSSENPKEVTMILPMEKTVEEQWQKLHSKVKNQIRKAEKSNVAITKTTDTKIFYQIYSENMGRLGTPVHSKKFFDLILEEFGTNAYLLNASIDHTAVGSMLLIENKGTMADPFASTRQQFNKYCPNMLMYWFAIKKAIENSCHSFDMGRSQKDSGTYSFKKQWGAEPIETSYDDLFATQNKTTTDFYRSNNAKKMASLWQKMPLSLQQFLGPKVRKYIP